MSWWIWKAGTPTANFDGTREGEAITNPVPTVGNKIFGLLFARGPFKNGDVVSATKETQGVSGLGGKISVIEV